MDLNSGVIKKKSLGAQLKTGGLFFLLYRPQSKAANADGALCDLGYWMGAGGGSLAISISGYFTKLYATEIAAK